MVSERPAFISLLTCICISCIYECIYIYDCYENFIAKFLGLHTHLLSRDTYWSVRTQSQCKYLQEVRMHCYILVDYLLKFLFMLTEFFR